MTITKAHRTRFFLKNLLRGIFFLTVIIVGYILAKKYFGVDLKILMGPLYESPRTVFSIFFISEVVFGIIPPEFFMLWSQRHNDLGLFISNVVMLTAISYSAGVIGFWFGAYMNSSQVFNFFKSRIFGKFEDHFNRFGGFLVIVAAMTPLPFSGICMLVGSTRYPFKRFLLFSLARLIRFTLYAYIIWQAKVA